MGFSPARQITRAAVAVDIVRMSMDFRLTLNPLKIGQCHIPRGALSPTHAV